MKKTKTSKTSHRYQPYKHFFLKTPEVLRRLDDGTMNDYEVGVDPFFKSETERTDEDQRQFVEDSVTLYKAQVAEDEKGQMDVADASQLQSWLFSGWLLKIPQWAFDYGYPTLSSMNESIRTSAKTFARLNASKFFTFSAQAGSPLAFQRGYLVGVVPTSVLSLPSFASFKSTLNAKGYLVMTGQQTTKLAVTLNAKPKDESWLQDESKTASYYKCYSWTFLDDPATVLATLSPSLSSSLSRYTGLQIVEKAWFTQTTPSLAENVANAWCLSFPCD
jgi:hypothetical protein